MFFLAKAAVPHNNHQYRFGELGYAQSDPCWPTPTTKGAIQNFAGGLAQMLAIVRDVRGFAAAGASRRWSR